MRVTIKDAPRSGCRRNRRLGLPADETPRGLEDHVGSERLAENPRITIRLLRNGMTAPVDRYEPQATVGAGPVVAVRREPTRLGEQFRPCRRETERLGKPVG